MDRKRVYQYEAPAIEPGDRTRWIAADSAEQADNYARRKGWRRAGGEVHPQHPCGTDRRALKAMGCDAVL